MQVRVYQLRVKGKRRPWREVRNGPSFTGTLVSYRITHGRQSFDAITLQQGSQKAGLPDLYEPVVTGFAPNGFEIRGFERIDLEGTDIGVVQEWHCEDA